MKTCTHCAIEKPFEAFYRSSTHKSGYTSWCKLCESERNKVKNQSNKQSRLAKAKEWRDANKDKQASAVASWRERNPERLAGIYRDWSARNKDKVNAKWMQRNAGKKNRTPLWLTSEEHTQMQVEYALAAWCSDVMGEPYHVDHIVPLQGKTVSGLHVPWNLRVITGAENRSKSNHWSQS